MMPSDRNGFMIAAGDPIFAKYEGIFESIEEPDNDNGLQIDLNPQGIMDGKTELIRELIRAAQHYPRSLEKLFINLKFSFNQNDGSRMPVKTIKHWNEEPVFHKWLHTVYHQSPCFIFFLKDKTLRFHAMVGMFSLLDRTRPAFTIRGLSGAKFLQERKDEIEKEFQRAALSFMNYCRVAGIDPKPYMERVYEEMKHINDYEMMLGIYNERIAARSINLSIFPLKDKDFPDIGFPDRLKRSIE